MKTLNKIISILIIVILLTADFSVLGIGLKSYAISNTDNIKYDAYFVDSKGEKTKELEQETTNREAKLHIKVSVENQGYFNGVIELTSSNFKFKTDVTMPKGISKIEENKIELKQISAGEKVDIDVVVQILTPNILKVEDLTKTSTISLVGTYIKEKSKATEINEEEKVQLKLVPTENAEVELVTSIITNQLMEVNGENKRVIQMLINSRVAENQYPVQKETLTLVAPVLKVKEQEKNVHPENVEAIAMSTQATNGEGARIIDNIVSNDGIIEIEINNEENNEQEIQWTKSGYDQIIVTLIYEENVEIEEDTMTATAKMKLYNDTELEGNSEQIIKEELNNVLVVQENSSVSQIYKGQLYANIVSTNKKEIEYKDQTTIFITNSNIVDQIKVIENAEKFVSGEAEVFANGRYISTKINKEKMLDILGEEGKIAISYEDKTVTLSKSSDVDENGDIVVEYNEKVSGIEILTTNPEKAGVLEIVHTKALTENEYTKEEIQNITSMKNEIQIQGVQAGKVILEETKDRVIKLEETITKAELKMDKTYLSTMSENNVVMDIKLVTDGEQYDLYKNPEIKIKLPEAVEEVTINNADKLYAEGFKIDSNYDEKTKTIILKLFGEQTDYTVASATQIFLQLDLTIKLDKKASKAKTNVEMQYTNENATNYYGETTEAGIITKQVNIVTQTGLIAMGNAYIAKEVSTYSANEEYLADTSLTLTEEQAGATVIMTYTFTNNSEETYKNIRIKGILPTVGNTIDSTENTLQTTLIEVEAGNSKIYYTENPNATEEIDNEENGWTEDLSKLNEAKLFLVVSEEEFEVGKTIEIISKVIITNEIEDGQISVTKAQMIYDTDTKQNNEKSTNEIKLQTVVDKTVLVGAAAFVNGEQVQENTSVKVGEVIEYIVAVNTAQKLTNVTLKGTVPEGTVFLDEDGNEVEETKEISKVFENVEVGETFSYSVRVKENIGTLVNKIVATGEGVNAESTFSLKTESANIQVELKANTDNDYWQRKNVLYHLTIKNLENYELQNVKVKIELKGAMINRVYVDGEPQEDENGIYVISKLKANGEKTMAIETALEETTETSINVIVEQDEKIYNIKPIKNVVYIYDVKFEASSPTQNTNIELSSGKISIEYNFTMENVGDLDSSILFKDTVSKYLEISEFYINGELQSTPTSREIIELIEVKKGEKATIKIVAKISELYVYTSKFKELEILNNVSIVNEEGEKTAQIKHTLLGIPGFNYNPEDYGEEEPSNPENPDNPSTPDNPDNPSNPDTPIVSADKTISGKAWLDVNQNGEKDTNDTVLRGIKVKLYDLSTKSYAKDKDGKIIEVTTDENGKYDITNLKKGQYIVLFEYDAENYEITTYKKLGVSEANNSNVVLNNIEIDGEEILYAVTDIINLQSDVTDINIGLKLKIKFDLELNKYISKITVQTNKQTKTYNFDKSTFSRVEIRSKELSGATVIFEYTIEVKNTGDIAGYANNIIDYLPNGLTFNSELNSDWYLLEGNLYTKKFESTIINPGETQEIKLILTKIMTNDNVGLINNRAEIYESYNKYGIPDVDSTPNNQINTEDDIGSADVFVGISTGGTIALYVIIGIINIILFAIFIRLVIAKNENNIMKF